MLTLEDTPIEKHVVKNRVVFVKRDDLYGLAPAPQLGKLRGLKVLLQDYRKNGVKLVGCWDTRVSSLGQGVAAMCRDIPEMRCIISYPALKGASPPASILISKALDAEILPIRGNHVSICYSQVKKYVENRGGVMLPFGLECTESVDAIAKEASRIKSELIEGGCLVVSCGSGVTLSGIIKGLNKRPSEMHGISSGRSVKKIEKCLTKHLASLPKGLTIIPAAIPYYDSYKTTCPFPTHPNYDLKAWKYLVDKINKLPEPIFFWNIGA